MKPYILMLEDDSDDRLITRNFFKDISYEVNLEFLESAEEVMPFLDACPVNGLPFLILLDKNVPVSGGDGSA